MAYLVQQKSTSEKKLVHTSFDLNETNKVVQLLDHLIELHQVGMNQNNWDKLFVISENVNQFSVYGKSSNIGGLLDIAKLVSHLMLQFGLPTDEINDRNINVEFHYAKFNENKTNEKYLHPFFAVHCDDYGGTNYPVHTFIVYRTNNLIEGNFAFYDDGYGHETSEPSEIVNIQDVSKGFVKAVMFDGKLNHNALPIVSGERYALSFQIKKL